MYIIGPESRGKSDTDNKWNIHVQKRLASAESPDSTDNRCHTMLTIRTYKHSEPATSQPKVKDGVLVLSVRQASILAGLRLALTVLIIPAFLTLGLVLMVWCGRKPTRGRPCQKPDAEFGNMRDHSPSEGGL